MIRIRNSAIQKAVEGHLYNTERKRKSLLILTQNSFSCEKYPSKIKVKYRHFQIWKLKKIVTRRSPPLKVGFSSWKEIILPVCHPSSAVKITLFKDVNHSISFLTSFCRILTLLRIDIC